MAKLSEHLKKIVVIVLKLTLLLLKRSGKPPVHRTKDALHKHTSRNSTCSADKSETTDNSFSSMTPTYKLSLSSGIGSSICLTDSHHTPSHVEEVLKSRQVCPLEDEIEQLRTENHVLREKLSQIHVEPRRNLVYRRGRTSLSQAMSSTPRPTTSEDEDIHDVVQEKLKLKLEEEKEENSRLQNYINDVMYMVLETRPSLLET